MPTTLTDKGADTENKTAFCDLLQITLDLELFVRTKESQNF